MKKYLLTVILAATSTLTYAGDRTADQLINYFEEQRLLTNYYEQRECRRNSRRDREIAEDVILLQSLERNRRDQQAQMALVLQLLAR